MFPTYLLCLYFIIVVASELKFHRGSGGSRPSRRSSQWGNIVNMSNKQSQDYPQDKYTSPQPMLRGRDQIYNAHVDPFKEEFLDTDDYVSVILEFGELPDPDYCELGDFGPIAPVVSAVYS